MRPGHPKGVAHPKHLSLSLAIRASAALVSLAMSTPHHIPAADGLKTVRTQIDAAARDAGRDPADVTLVAVSKTFPGDAIIPVLENGQRVFGENRVQETQQKWPALRTRFPDAQVHLIGPLQTNKAREAVSMFDAIHSLDRPKLARVLAEECAAQGRTPDFFVQINTGSEAQKSGVLAVDADSFIKSCRADFGLRIAGLMCIPPAGEDPAPHFSLLAEIAVRNGVDGLSMGMSADFKIAIAHGATYVRVGSAIFGTRPNQHG